jgi:hypothetical protein
MINTSQGFPGNDKTIKKLQEDISDLKSKIDFANRVYLNLTIKN